MNGHRPARNQRPRHIAVARTIVEPQPDLDAFLNAARRQLLIRICRGAVVGTLGSLHMTLLEGAATVPVLRQRGFNPQDVHNFYTDLQQYLDNIEGTRERTVIEVDPRRPVGLFGRHQNRVALHCLPSEPLRRERAHIEAFLAQRFGSVPVAREFDEHIVIATLPPHGLRPGVRLHPETLFDGLKMPEVIAVNGLAVHLNGIGDTHKS